MGPQNRVVSVRPVLIGCVTTEAGLGIDTERNDNDTENWIEMREQNGEKKERVVQWREKQMEILMSGYGNLIGGSDVPQ